MTSDAPLNHIWDCQQTFSVKGQMVNISGFVGHIISTATTQLCCYSMKAAADNM